MSLNNVKIQITLPKTTVYPQRVNHPSSGTTALNENLSFPENFTRNYYSIQTWLNTSKNKRKDLYALNLPLIRKMI